MKVLDYEGLKTFATKIKSLLAGKQDELTAGSNITITNNKISATDTKYTAGTNISISGNKISATDTKYSAGENITITNNKISASGKVTVVETVEVPLTNTAQGFWYPAGKLICRNYSNGLVSVELITGVAELGFSKPLTGTLPIGFKPKNLKIVLLGSIGNSLEFTESSYGTIGNDGEVTLNPAIKDGKDLLMPEYFYHPEA